MTLLIHHKKSLVLMPILCYKNRAERDFADLIPALATAVRSDDMTKELPSPDILRKLLRYEPETGKLFWRERPRELFQSDEDWKKWNARFAGSETFNVDNGLGYFKGRILGKNFLAHRIIWVMQTGLQPLNHVDHIDRDSRNNQWKNLRAATNAQNQANSCSRKGALSQYKGVCWDDSKQKWLSRIRVNGVRRHLGRFESEQEAALAYDEAAKRLQGEFAHLNFPERKVA